MPEASTVQDLTASILSFDPGKTTGWALFTGGVVWDAGQDQPQEFLERMDDWTMRSTYGDAQVVGERYIITPETLRKSRQHWSLEIIGAARYLCTRSGIPFTLQSPSEAKAFATNDKLRQLGWYVRGMQHANDALRHLLVFLVNNKQVPPGLTAG